MAEPTAQDIRNAELRASIAARFAAGYAIAEALAVSVFGPGWKPCGRHSLVTHAAAERARREGGRAEAAMVVISARKQGETRHFVVEDGKAREVPGYLEAFGEMLTEPDPERWIEVKGEKVHPHSYELHWGGFEEGYAPRSAEQLAAAREKREERAVEKEAEGSFFADLIREEGYVKPKRKGQGR